MTTDAPKERRVKKRHLAGFGAACLTALTVVEAGAPLCPVLDLLSPKAGQVCRAVTLSAPAVRDALKGPERAE